ncbi:MAG: hypothetical protein Q9165_002780 [Trypethelium subeluteriae]
MAPMYTPGPLASKNEVTNLIKLVVSIFGKVVSTASTFPSSQALPEPPNGPHLLSRSSQPTEVNPDAIAKISVIAGLSVGGSVVVGILFWLWAHGIFGICFRVSPRHTSPSERVIALTTSLVRHATGRPNIGFNRVFERWQKGLVARRLQRVNDQVRQAIQEVANLAVLRARAATRNAGGGPQQRRLHQRSRSEPIVGSEPIELVERRTALDDGYALSQVSLGDNINSESVLGPRGLEA